jgi:sugar phosphate isomerase/epimerase
MVAVVCSTAVRSGSSLEKALADIEQAGFEAIDLLAIDGWVHVNTVDLAERYDETLARVDGLLEQHRLKVVALNTGVSPQLHHRSDAINAQRMREVEGLIRLMRHLGVEVAAVQPRNPDPVRPWEEVLRDCVATLREQVDAGRDAGVTFALEFHVRSPFETLEQARRLLEEMPDLPLAYDPSHYVMQGIDIKEIGWLLDHAHHVHLRDAAPDEMQVPFGMGQVDFNWLLGSLQDRGYRGHFSIEYLESDDFDALDSALRLRDAIAHRFF